MTPAAHPTLDDGTINDVVARLRHGDAVRKRLPFSGRLYIERPVPFLYVYRHSAGGIDRATEKLIIGESSYLLGSHQKAVRKAQASLVRAVVATLHEVFGAFLVVEVRAGEAPLDLPDPPLPAVRIVNFRDEQSEPLVDTLRRALTEAKCTKTLWRVDTTTAGKASLKPLPVVSAGDARALGCTRLVLEVPPIYRASDNQTVYPTVMRTMQRLVGVALRKTVYVFAKTHTRQRPANYHAMGRRALVKVVWEADRQLAQVARQFDFLLALTPNNLERVWQIVRHNNLERMPAFRYRPLTTDVSQAKRQLFSVPLERIEDPAVADLFLEKQLELDRQLTLLADRGSKRVLFGSLQLYGGVTAKLLRTAEALIELIPPGARERGKKQVSAEHLAARAAQEIAWFKETGLPVDGDHIQIRDDIPGGLMVSQGQLLIGAGSTYPASRVEALVQHEVGTHVLTYLNGQCQRLQQLSVGLANYDETQEGLAVLAEYLVGGLSRPRLRALAGRVVAAHCLVEGATFIDTFRLLLRYGFTQQAAFFMVARAFRGGGLTKDAVYLRGLGRVLEYLASGESLETLFVGKIALTHIGIIRELQTRKILSSDPLLPRYLLDDTARSRLARVQKGLQPHELLEA